MLAGNTASHWRITSLFDGLYSLDSKFSFTTKYSSEVRMLRHALHSNHRRIVTYSVMTYNGCQLLAQATLPSWCMPATTMAVDIARMPELPCT
jgi:hypothetical protein